MKKIILLSWFFVVPHVYADEMDIFAGALSKIESEFDVFLSQKEYSRAKKILQKPLLSDFKYALSQDLPLAKHILNNKHGDFLNKLNDIKHKETVADIIIAWDDDVWTEHTLMSDIINTVSQFESLNDFIANSKHKNMINNLFDKHDGKIKDVLARADEFQRNSILTCDVCLNYMLGFDKKQIEEVMQKINRGDWVNQNSSFIESDLKQIASAGVVPKVSLDDLLKSNMNVHAAWNNNEKESQRLREEYVKIKDLFEENQDALQKFFGELAQRLAKEGLQIKNKFSTKIEDVITALKSDPAHYVGNEKYFLYLLGNGTENHKKFKQILLNTPEGKSLLSKLVKFDKEKSAQQAQKLMDAIKPALEYFFNPQQKEIKFKISKAISETNNFTNLIDKLQDPDLYITDVEALAKKFNKNDALQNKFIKSLQEEYNLMYKNALIKRTMLDILKKEDRTHLIALVKKDYVLALLTDDQDGFKNRQKFAQEALDDIKFGTIPSRLEGLLDTKKNAENFFAGKKPEKPTTGDENDEDDW